MVSAAVALATIASCASGATAPPPAPTPAAAAAPAEPASEPAPLEAEDATPGSEGDEGADALASVTAAAPAAASVAAEAARIVAAARTTSYQHHTHIDEAAGAFDVDCSGFVGYVLRRVAPAARDELVAGSVKRPLARHFVDWIVQLPASARHWQAIPQASALQPGDLIAWLRPPDSKSRDTGHVMIVAQPPRMLAGAAEISVYDASALRHGRTDQRAASARTGVGTGTIVLQLDADGRPLSFRWAPGAGYHVHATQIVFARTR